MLARIKRWKLDAEDWLRYSPAVRGLLSRWTLLRDRGGPGTPALMQSIVRRCAAARLTTSADREDAIRAGIRERVARLDFARIDWPVFIADIDDRRMHKATVLKPYLGSDEKGVVFISFENQWVKLLRLNNLTDFAARYDLVQSTSGNANGLVNYVFPAAYPSDTIFSLMSAPTDERVLPLVSPKFVVAPLYASSWVNPAWFTPTPRRDRPFDLVMVANFAKFKRHQTLFRALRRMPRELRVLLIGQDQDGRTQETIRELARWHGVEGRFELRSNQGYREVTQALCQAKASLILSKREGSCVVVTESMFADTPMGLLRGAEIGSRVYINDQTGRFFDEANLDRQLMDFLATLDRYEPRRWAEANISCVHSSAKLNTVLKEHALSHGRRWTMDLAPMQWAPDPKLLHDADRERLRSERDAIKERYGLEVGRE